MDRPPFFSSPDIFSDIFMNTALCLFSYNAAATTRSFLDALNSQSHVVGQRLLVDSSSTDGTAGLFSVAGFRIHTIPNEFFNHGGTRQLALELCQDAEILVFMTQDALLATADSLHRLVAEFVEPTVGVAYGRQLPRQDANPIEAYARIFNYPAESQIKSFEDRHQLGIKTCFISNSFAAYRCSALQQVGGFPDNNIVSEDTYVAAKMLVAGWQVKYCADAMVYHSHNYTISKEFQRYFDLGVFHSREPWIRDLFGQAEAEGGQFVVSHLTYIIKKNVLLIPSTLLRTVVKYLGFKLGFCEAYLPNKLKMWLSMQKNFWLK